METNTGYFMTDISTLFIDAMFKYKGFSMMFEYAKRHSKSPIATDEQGNLTGEMVNIGYGFNTQMGYLINRKWEISSRFTHINLDKLVNIPRENQYTIGVSNFIKEHHLKVQSEFTYIDYLENKNQLLFRIQFDIHF